MHGSWHYLLYFFHLRSYSRLGRLAGFDPTTEAPAKPTGGGASQPRESVRKERATPKPKAEPKAKEDKMVTDTDCEWKIPTLDDQRFLQLPWLLSHPEVFFKDFGEVVP